MLYAGQLAQKQFAPRSWRKWHTSTGSIHGSADDDQMIGIALQQTDDTGVPLLMKWLKHEAEFLVKERWGDICAVASALLEQKTLSGDAVWELISLRYGPLPDKRLLNDAKGKTGLIHRFKHFTDSD
jgi:hypothetical protein